MTTTTTTVTVPPVPNWLNLDGIATEEQRTRAAELTHAIHHAMEAGEEPDGAMLREAANLYSVLDVGTTRAGEQIPQLGDLDPSGGFRVDFADGAHHVIDAITGGWGLFEVLDRYSRSIHPDEIADKTRRILDAEQIGD